MKHDLTAPAASGTLGSILAELLALAVTVAISGLILALVIFAPQSFVDSAYNSAPRGISGYASSIAGYFASLLSGRLSDPAHNAAAWADLARSARHTIELLGISMALALPIGIGWGALLALARRPLLRGALFGLNTVVMAVPVFAIMLLAMEGVSTLTLRTGFRLTFVQGYGLDRHLLLPAGVLVLRGSAYLARALHIAQDDVLRQDWIRAARARGLGGLALWRRHVLPALRLPLLGITLGMLRLMVAGIVIIDYMYGWGGLGQRMLNFQPFRVGAADTAMSTSAALTLVILFVVVDALGQLALRYADPRLRDLKG
jgi:ABC-type dipeptide/oligopeptide/nickel transport system permease component